MTRLIEERRDELHRLCRKHGVRKLEVFGSAAGDSFDPKHSDLDFLVTFDSFPPGGYADAYFGLLEDLQALFQKPVDLIVESAITNPYFRKAVEASRVPLYAA